jgi:beta-glucosidase
VAREAVQKSQVLFKNDGVLPLSKGERILVAGRGAENVGMQCGGWTITWQGNHGETTVGTTLLKGILNTAADGEAIYDPEGTLVVAEKVPVGIVVVGETPYAEGLGDNGDLRLVQEDRDVIARMRAKCEKLVIVLLCGRPMIITDELALADAFVVAWQPGTEGQGVADVLFGDAPFTGRLSVSWPRSMAQVPLTALKADPQGPLFPLGYGLS